MTPAAVLSVVVRANTAQANSALTRTHGLMQGMAAQGGIFSERVARSLKMVTLGALGFGAAAGVMAIDFDKAMRNVNSLVKLPEPAFQRLSKRVLALAGPTAQAPKVLAEGLYTLVSSGFDANESMLVLRKSAIAASAGLTTTEVATKAVAAVLNAYRLPAKSAGQVSDDLFQTVNLGVLTFEDLAQTIGDVLPFSSTLGVNLKAVGAATTTMTKAGLSAPETMTRIKNAMVALIKPTDALKAAYAELGVAGGEDLIKKFGGGRIGFQKGLEAVISTTDGTKAAIAELFPNIRSLGGVLALTGGNLQRANEDLKAFKDTAGATADVFAEQQKAAAFKIQKAWAQIQADMITMGAVFAPIIATLVQGIAKLVAAFESLPDVLKTSIVLMGLLAYPMFKIVALGTQVAIAMGLMRAASVGGAAAMAATGASTAVAAGQMSLFAPAAGASAAAILGPAGIAVGAVALTAGLTYLAIKLIDTQTAMDKVRETSGQLQASFHAQVKARNDFVAADKKVAAIEKEIQGLEEQGLSGSKQWVDAIRRQADAQLALNDAQRKHAFELEKQRDKIPELREEVDKVRESYQRWRGEAAVPVRGGLVRDAASARDMAEAIERLRGAILNAKRASEGFKPIPEEAMHTLSTFRDVFGKPLSLKIGMIKDPRMVEDLEKMSNQLAFIGKEQQAKVILSDKALNAGQKMAQLRDILLKVTGGKYTIAMDVQQVEAAIKKANALRIYDKNTNLMSKLSRSHFSQLGDTATFEIGKINKAIKTGKDPTNQMIASYRNMRKNIKQAMDESKISVESGQRAINRLLRAEMKLLGINVAPGTIGSGDVLQAGSPSARGQKGLAMVPGRGTGDSYPVTAFLEPGEVFGVFNREAVPYINKVNAEHPRFQKGGTREAEGKVNWPDFYGANKFAIQDDINARALDITVAMVKQFFDKQAGAAGGGNATWRAIDLIAKATGNAPGTLTGRLGQPDSWHGVRDGPGRARATDYSGGNMYAGAMRTYRGFGKDLLELIHTPLGFSVSDGNKVAPYATADHYDHYHVAFRRGGIWRLAKGGTVMGASAYGFGEAGTGTVGASGKDLRGKLAFAELEMGQAMGHLPFGAKRRIAYHGKSAIGIKLDIGAGGGSVRGHPRKIDLWRDLANKIGFGRNLDLVTVGMPVNVPDSGAEKSKTKTPEWTLTVPQKLTDKVTTLAAEVETFREWADRAATMGVRVGGKDEIHWLNKELQTLAKLRDILIRIYKFIQNQIKKYRDAIKAAKGTLAQRERKKILGKKPVDQKLIDKWRQHLEASETLLADTEGGPLGKLTEIQGTVNPPNLAFKRGVNLGAQAMLGVFGGTIGEVQQAIIDAGAKIMTAGYGTHGLPIDLSQFFPTFAKGGIVPGTGAQLILAHGGELIVPEKMAGGGTFGFSSGLSASFGFGSTVGGAPSAPLAPPSSQIEILTMYADLAALTSSLVDDIAVYTNLVSYWTQELARLQSIGAPATEISAAASSLASAQESLSQLQLDAVLGPLEMAMALAQLTNDLGDDVIAQQAIVSFWASELARLQAAGASPAEITAAAQSLATAQQALSDLQQQQALAPIEMAAALAQLTPTIQDDMAAAQDLVDYWTSTLQTLQETGGSMADITAAANALFSAQQALQQLQGQEQVNLQEQLNLAQQMLDEAARREYALTGQLSVLSNFPALPSYQYGGTVPGIPGKPYLGVVHGGEEYLGVGKRKEQPSVVVVIESGAGIDPSKVRVIAGEEAERAMGQAKWAGRTPGRPGIF